MAPPVALLSLIRLYETLIVPDGADRLNRTPAVALCKVTKLPEVPAVPSVVSVCVVPAVKLIVAGTTELVRLLNVFDPEMVNAPDPP